MRTNAHARFVVYRGCSAYLMRVKTRWICIERSVRGVIFIENKRPQVGVQGLQNLLDEGEDAVGGRDGRVDVRLRVCQRHEPV